MADAVRASLDRVRAFHRGEAEATSDELDVALGLSPRRGSDAPFEDPELVARHPGQSFADLPTPYDVTRGLFETLDLGPDDVVFDLGCGTGRVVLYGAAVCPAAFFGIEIVEERVAEGRAAIEASGQARVTIVQGSALELDLAPATVVYLARPFGDENEAKMMARLATEARKRRLRVVTHRIRPGRIDEVAFEVVSVGTLSFYRSRHPART